MRGDSQRQLTLRAVIMGGILGMFMAVSNLYTTLKIGWSFGVAITACVISFVVWNAICSLLGGRVSRMSVLENNCMQSTASAAGYSTGATLATHPYAIGRGLLVLVNVVPLMIYFLVLAKLAEIRGWSLAEAEARTEDAFFAVFDRVARA